MRSMLIGLAVAATAGLAGCGDSGGGGGQLSQGEFVSQADAICADAVKKQNAIDIPSISASPSDADLEKFADALDEGIALTRDEIGKLRDLNPPESAAAEWGKTVDELDASMDDVDKASGAARDGDAAGLAKSLNDASAKGESATRRAKALGLKVCSQS
jgi:hypothetical protein